MTNSRRTYAVTLFLILIVCYGYFMPRWADWGANSRANLVYAFGDQGVLNIDAYHTNTGDKACFPGPYTPNPNAVNEGTCEGNYYSDKSLGPSLLALPFYMVFKGIAALPPVDRIIQSGAGMGAMGDTLNPDGQGANPAAVYQFLALTFITFFASAVPSALLGVVIFLMACRFAKREWYAFVLALGYGLGTMAFPYSNALYQHQLAAFGAFVGFYYLWRVIKEGANPNWLWLVGLLFSLATITEYPIVPMLGIIFIWAVIQMPNRLALYRVILGAIPLGLIFMAYNYAAFGSVLPVGYQYSTNWQGEHQTGFLSLTVPSLESLVRLYGLTFSPIRGIFLMSPFLLFAIPGFIMMWRQQKAIRGVVTVLLLAVAFFLFYNSSSVMWWGGFTVGPRYLVPMLPFMVLPIIFVLNALLERWWGRALTALLLVISIVSVGAMTIAGQQWPPVEVWPTTFDLMNQSSTLFDYSLPLLAQGDVARNYGLVIGLRGLLSLLPLIIALGIISIGVPLLMRRRSGNAALVAVQSRPGVSS
ncbi:MAG TPA: hypothetical protein PLQ56_06500 [Aggregatilineales bacterium]|nr:hypothetical protein [Aggregatilineales bacterium]